MHIRRIAPLSRALSAPHSLANPRYALSRAAGAHISLRMAQSPAATLRASVQDFNQPNSVYTSRHQNLWSLSFKWGFHKVFVTLRVYLLWGLSMRSSFLSGSLFSLVLFTFFFWRILHILHPTSSDNYKCSALGSPQILICGESEGISRLYQLAEWFGLCDLIAERDTCGAE